MNKHYKKNTLQFIFSQSFIRIISNIILYVCYISAGLIFLQQIIPNFTIRWMGNNMMRAIIYCILFTPWVLLLTLTVDFIRSKKYKLCYLTIGIFAILIFMIYLLSTVKVTAY